MHIPAGRLAFLSIVPLLAALACDGRSPVAAPPKPASSARMQILLDGHDLAGLTITMTPSGFPRFTAAVVDFSGAPSTTYGPPVLSATNPAVVRIDGDGSLVLLAMGTFRIIATAQALSPSQNPQVLKDSVTITIVCTAESRPGLSVFVRDSITGAFAGNGATMRAMSVTWSDSVVVPASADWYTSWSTAWERAGTYSVTVERDGYLPWRRDSIVVSHDLCHVVGQEVNVRLVRR